MTILEEAQSLVSGDRQSDYGTPAGNHAKIAVGWSQILGVTVTAQQVALCMVWTKIARHTHSPKRDNLTDACGYLQIVDMIDSEAPNGS